MSRAFQRYPIRLYFDEDSCRKNITNRIFNHRRPQPSLLILTITINLRRQHHRSYVVDYVVLPIMAADYVRSTTMTATMLSFNHDGDSDCNHNHVHIFHVQPKPRPTRLWNTLTKYISNHVLHASFAKGCFAASECRGEVLLTARAGFTKSGRGFTKSCDLSMALFGDGHL